MTKLSSQTNETQDVSPAIRASLTSLGRLLSSFGGDSDDVAAYMNAIADELEAKLAALQAQSWSRARLRQELRAVAFDPAGDPDTFCALYLRLTTDRPRQPQTAGTASAPGADLGQVAAPASIGGELLRLVDTLLDAREPQHRRRRALEQITAQNQQAALPVVQKLHYLAQLMVAQDFFVLFGQEKFLEARAALDDLAIVRDLLIQAYTQFYPQRHQATQQTLAAMFAPHDGLSALLAILNPEATATTIPQQLRQIARQDADRAVRCWALHTLVEQGDEHDPIDLTVYLGDEAWLVAMQASNLITELAEPPIGRLTRIAQEPASSRSHQLWAIYTLMRLGVDVDAILAAMPDLRVPIPAIVPPVVREAIVRHWTKHFSTQEDVRWLIEELQLPPAPPYDFTGMRETLAHELRAHGVTVGEYVYYADYVKQGSASFGLIPVNEDFLYISQIGPLIAFAAVERYTDEHGKQESRYLVNIANVDPTGEKRQLAALCRRVATAVGYHWLEEALLTVDMPGYQTYFRESSIQSLVFQWVD